MFTFRPSVPLVGLALAFACPIIGQQSDAGHELFQLNNAALRLHADAMNSAPMARIARHSQAAGLFEDRAKLLEQLISRDPAQVFHQAFPPGVVRSLAELFPESAKHLESHGVWTGTMETWIEDDFEKGATRVFHRLKTSSESLDVFLTDGAVKAIAGGGTASIEGIRVGKRVAASSAQVIQSAPACSNTGLQNVAVLLVSFPTTTPPAGVTAQSVSDIFFGTAGPSFDGFLREVSYGRAYALGKVGGWYTLSREYACGELDAMRNEAVALAAGEIDFTTINRVFVVHPNNSCPSGFAQSGCFSMPYPGGSFLASNAYLRASYFAEPAEGLHLATHEFGHNLGLLHAGTRDYGSDPVGPVGTTGIVSDQGDYSTTLGVWNNAHYPVSQKAMLGWLAPATQYLTIQENGTFTIEPVESPTSGAKALKVRRGTGNEDWLWIEYRQPAGPYNTIPYPQMYGGALIHQEDSFTSNKAHLLDFTRETPSFSDPALLTGKTWSDPYTNLSLNVLSASASGLTLSVTYGAATCSRQNPTVDISPANPSASPGQNVSYKVTVKNNDSSVCSAATFDLTSSLPSGWTTMFSTSSLRMNPGQSASVTMTKTVPASAAAATYSVNATATGGGYNGAGSAICTVNAPLPLAIAVTIPKPSYSRRGIVPITAIVTRNGSPVSGATVRFTMTKPNLAVTTYQISTDSSGDALWNYRVGAKDPLGVYTVSAVASSGAESVTSAPATFQVN